MSQGFCQPLMAKARGGNTPRGISSSMPPRDEIPTATPMFSGMNFSMVYVSTSHHALFYRKFKMAAEKPQIFESFRNMLKNNLKVNFKRQ